MRKKGRFSNYYAKWLLWISGSAHLLAAVDGYARKSIASVQLTMQHGM